MQNVITILILAIIIWLIQNYQMMLGVIGACVGISVLGAIIRIAMTGKSQKESLQCFDRAHQKNKGVTHSFEKNSKTPTANQSRFKSSLTLENKAEIIRDIKRNGGLIIDKPWITMILSGQKTWEMRSRVSKKTGYIALIEKGTKQVSGVARIDGYSGKLTIQELNRSQQKHRVPVSKYTADDYKWFIAIHLSNVVKLMQRIPYHHKSGAVTWVKLGEQAEVIKQIEKQIGDLLSQPTKQKNRRA